MFAASLVLCELLLTAPAAQQSTTAADVELWRAALEQLRSDHNGADLALVDDTLPAADFTSYLSTVTREQALVAKLLERNQSSKRLPSPMELPPRTSRVDAKSIRKPGRSEIDHDAVRRRVSARRRLVRLSLPVFSDDGTRALVFTWTSGGFEDETGGGYVFERKQGRWIVVDYLARWIT